MASKEVRDQVDSTEDFVASGHHQHSLRRIRQRYPEGAPDHIVARALGRTEAQIRGMYAAATKKLRKLMGVSRDE
jgi:hypothetical protein